MKRHNLHAAQAVPLIILALGACADRSEPEPDVASAEYPREVLAAHMRDHFFKATEMQVAVINANLESLQEPAAWMADHASSAAMPQEWIPYAQAMHVAAQDAVEATDLASAARAVADMAVACGNCHQALSAEVGFAVDRAPPPGDDRATHMKRHAWASGRLWEGMIMPSGVVWDGGAGVLSEAPLTPADLEADLEVLSRVSAMEQTVHALGEESLGVADQAERARLYGEFLATCAACHAQTGRGEI